MVSSSSKRRKNMVCSVSSEQRIGSSSEQRIGSEGMMGIPVIKSSQLASTTVPCPPLYVPAPYIAETEESKRVVRKQKANAFLRQYILGHLPRSHFYSFDKKTCIWRNGDCSWLDDSSGIQWVGIHGKDSICIVTMAETMERGRIHGDIQCYGDDEIVCDFRRTLIPEIEDIADPSSKVRVMLAQSIEKPFGIVSVKCGHESVDESASGGYEDDKYGEKSAIKFIQEKMKTADAFSSEETIQIAISAFQLLLNKKFNVDDIGVSVWDLKEVCSKELDKCDIKHHLAEINPCSENQSRRLLRQRLGTRYVFGPVSRQALGSPSRSRRLGISKKGVVEYLKCEIEDLSRRLFVLRRVSKRALGSPSRIRRIRRLGHLSKGVVLELDTLKNEIEDWSRWAVCL